MLDAAVPHSPMRQLVLCHGFMTDRGLWARMEAGLAALGHCRFADQSRDDSLPALAGRILDEAPPAFVLVGFSMGGYVAREVVRLAPSRVAGLVLVNTSARPTGARVAARNRALIEITRERGFSGLSRKALRNALHPTRRDDEDLVRAMQDMALRMGEGAFLRQLAVTREDGRPGLKEIGCPTLVIWSRQDELRSLEEAEELAQGIPDARLEIVEECGHMTPLERPKALLRILANWFSERGL